MLHSQHGVEQHFCYENSDEEFREQSHEQQNLRRRSAHPQVTLVAPAVSRRAAPEGAGEVVFHLPQGSRPGLLYSGPAGLSRFASNFARRPEPKRQFTCREALRFCQTLIANRRSLMSECSFMDRWFTMYVHA